MKRQKISVPDDLPVLSCRDGGEWARWLARHHAASAGVWLRIAKKNAGFASVTYEEAVEEALRFGWIDGQKRRGDEESWLQRFTRRGPRSVWSAINRRKAEKLISEGRMMSAGLEAVEQARRNGNWDVAYSSQAAMTEPDDFRFALNANPSARAFFDRIASFNRYAILYRVTTAKKPETREKRIRDLVTMLARGETIHPEPPGRPKRAS